MASAFAKKLAAVSKKWKAIKTTPPEGVNAGSDVPDGVYKARITNAELGESQSSGRMQVAWEATIVEGEQKGDVVRDYDGLETEKNLFYLQQKLGRLKQEVPDDISEIEEVLNAITKEKPLVRIRVRTKDDYQHFQINRVLDNEDGEQPEETEAEAEGETEAEPETDSNEVEMKVGMKASFKSGGKDLEGEVLEFVENDTKARIKTDKGTFKVKLDDLTVLAGEDEAVEEEPEAEPE